MSNHTGNNKAPLSGWKVGAAIALGIGISLYLIISTFNPGSLSKITFSYHLLLGLSIGAVTVVLRDFAFMYKLRLSTGAVLSWYKTLQLVIMWEFGAAVTPKLGEVAFVLYVLKKSGLSYGRSMAAIMLNSFLDNLAFVLLFGIMYLLVGPQMLFVPAVCSDMSGYSKLLEKFQHLAQWAWIGYLVVVGITAFLFTAIFLVPYQTCRFFHALSRIKFLGRLKGGLQHFGDEIELTSREFRTKGLWFWVRMCTATLINWMSRYALANALIFAFATMPLDMLLIYSRQFVLWIFIIIPFTPGSSGIAEGGFMALNCQFILPELVVAVTTVWRIYSYYLYLVLGMLFWRRWVKHAATT